MGFSSIRAFIDVVFGLGWVPPRISSVSDILEQYELKFEGVTHRNQVMESLSCESDLNLPSTPEICCVQLLNPLEHALEQVDHVLDSLETREGDLDEGDCVILSADLGPCLGDVEKDEGVIKVPALGGQRELPIRDTPMKPFYYHSNTLETMAYGEGTNDAPITYGSNLNPWVLTAKRSKFSPLNLRSLHAEMGLGKRKFEVSAAEILSPKEKGHLESLGLNNVTSEKNLWAGTHWARGHEWRSMNKEVSVMGCDLSDNQMYGTNNGFKPHHFTPHFHCYMLLKLIGSLAHLGTTTYIHELNIGCEVRLLDRKLGDDLRGGMNQLIPFTILIFDPGGQLEGSIS